MTYPEIAVIYKAMAKSLFYKPLAILIIEESYLQRFFHTLKYVSSLSSTKEMSFSKLNELEKQCKEILNDYDLYKNTSRKTLLTLILKDKVMIVLYILVLLIIIATVTAYMLHI